jgi:DNA-binding MarR family transcriptional regulator
MGNALNELPTINMHVIGMDAEHSLYGFLIERTAKRYKQVLQRIFQKHKFGITVDQWIILNSIDAAKQIYTNDLSIEVMKDAPTVTRIVDILEDKALVIRMIDDLDRRKTELKLSRKGHALVAKVRPVVIEMRKKGWDGLTDADLKKMRTILDTIHDNVIALEQKELTNNALAVQ